MSTVFSLEEQLNIKEQVSELTAKIEQGKSLLNNISPENRVGSAYSKVVIALEYNEKLLALYKSILSNN